MSDSLLIVCNFCGKDNYLCSLIAASKEHCGKDNYPCQLIAVSKDQLCHTSFTNCSIIMSQTGLSMSLLYLCKLTLLTKLVNTYILVPGNPTPVDMIAMQICVN